ncbi:hypothetical protein NA56DRAFT_422616 [Hyaloscypha hepaticicola]|uniref:Uncharacterized protein n=1 Tax=Hyaloscypha hepaticicola TaxID=2082293 RepID=A0A2J6PHB7_9HELO|nr:hypothetical protein NA56DRAFT_422616 [Hyaloscypha hepaticicola]
MLLVRTRPLLTRKPVTLVWSRRYLAMLALVTEAIRAWKRRCHRRRPIFSTHSWTSVMSPWVKQENQYVKI